MDSLRNKEYTELVDLLSNYSAKYTILMAEGGNGDEFWDCKLKIRLIQEEIEKRKYTSDPKFKDPDISIQKDVK